MSRNYYNRWSYAAVIAVALVCFFLLMALPVRAETIAEHAWDYIVEYKYLAIFLILFLCGIGLPIPEEVTLIASGYISDPQIHGYTSANVWAAIGVCILGILAGDLMTYLGGRLFGSHLLKSRVARVFLSEKNLHRADEKFKRHGWRVVFFARFFAGFRMAVYFITGSMKKSMWMLLFMDLLGTLLSVPLSVFIGFAFSAHIDTAFSYIMRMKHDVALGFFVALLAVVLAFIIFRKRKKDEQPQGQP